MDRTAYRRDTYARSQLWLSPGRYRLHATIAFTTSYVDGAVVLGHTRRDRNVRFTFNAGDLMYSVGERGQAATLDSIECVLHGVREAEASIAGQTIEQTVHFDSPATSFDLELVVDGGIVLAFVNGREIGSYHTPDGQPIEGYLGFAMGRGAVLVKDPTLTILRRRTHAGFFEPRARGLSLDDQGPITLSTMVNRAVDGVEVKETGAVLVWVPLPRARNRTEAGWHEWAATAFETHARARQEANGVRLRRRPPPS